MTRGPPIQNQSKKGQHAPKRRPPPDKGRLSGQPLASRAVPDMTQRARGATRPPSRGVPLGTPGGGSARPLARRSLRGRGSRRTGITPEVGGETLRLSHTRTSGTHARPGFQECLLSRPQKDERASEDDEEERRGM